MLGIVTPLLIDTLLISYYINLTGHFQWQALFLWSSLLALAAGGTWLAWRSIRQGLFPLNYYLQFGGDNDKIALADIKPLSLDELGSLTARFTVLQQRQLQLSAKMRAQAYIIDQVNEAVISTDLDGRITSWNQGATRMFGHTYIEMIGRPLADLLFGEAGRAGDKEMIFDLLQRSGRYVTEMKQTNSVNGDFDVQVSMSMLRDDAGKHVGIVTMFTDITQRKQAEQELRDNEERMRLAMESANQGFYDLNVQTGEAIVSPEYATMLGYDPEEFVETNAAWRERLHPDDTKKVYDVYTDYISGKFPEYRVEFRQHCKNGDWKWILSQGRLVAWDSDGQPLRMLGTHTDITDRMRVEEELQGYRWQLEKQISERSAKLLESERQLREAQKISHLGHWHWDITNNKVTWSEELYRLFGYDPEKEPASFERYEAIIHPEDQGLMRQFTADTLAGLQKSGVDYRVVTPAGVLRWVHAEASLTTPPDGGSAQTAMHGTVHEITERKAAEKELMEAKNEAERASRAKSEFLSRMSHELRTPMNAILGFAQILQTEDLQGELLDYVGEIKRAGDHLLTLINELLDLSRIESGMLVAELKPVQVATAIDEAVKIAGRTIEERGVSVEVSCKDEQNWIQADSTRLKQVLVNLLVNAAKYNRTGGTVTVSCVNGENSSLRIIVSDTGIGIPPDKVRQLFQPFNRLGAEKKGVDGVGIGLALSKHLTELMGGRIGVESRPGKGSEFWLELPLTEKSLNTTADGEPSVHQRVNGTKLDILYVEDNPANLRVVEAMVRKQDAWQLLSAMDGEQGLEMARKYRPDIILLDIHLPGIDGYEVLAQLRNDVRTHGIPVIALSADALAQDIQTGLEAGFAHYLVKPLRMADLLEILADIFSAKTSASACR